MTKSNVLILSAGRRVELVQSFQRALQEQQIEGRVYTTDMNPELSPACNISDKTFKAPRVTDSTYIDFIKDLCEKELITLVIPTIDTELQVLSEFKHIFESLGINIIISSPQLIKSCRDKRKTASLFESLDIAQPKIYSKDDISFPCFCKPYDGSCSIGAMAIDTANDLTDELLNDEKNIFMELIPKDYKEVTVDAYFNKHNKLCSLVPRERIEVRAGEVSKAITRKNHVYNYLLERLNNLEGAIGCITVQVFFNSETNSIKGLEINPRFGGGFPLSDAVGAKYPEWLVREYILNGKIDFFDDWLSNKIMLRYDAKVLVDAPENF